MIIFDFLQCCLCRHYELHGDGPGELSIRKNELTCNRTLGVCVCVCVIYEFRVDVFYYHYYQVIYEL
jgi:hypothetical protein